MKIRIRLPELTILFRIASCARVAHIAYQIASLTAKLVSLSLSLITSRFQSLTQAL